MPKFNIGENKIPYKIRKSPNRSSLALSINNSKELIVKIPKNSDVSRIENFLERKKSWVVEKMSEIDEQSQKPKEKEFLSGEKFLYKGRRYRLKVEESNIQDAIIEMKGGKFYIKAPKKLDSEERREKIKGVIRAWYKKKAKSTYPPKVKHFSSKIGVDYGDVLIEDPKNEWGNVKNNDIRLHWKTIMAPVHIQDYLIVHELAHLREETHSEEFWNVVGSVLPDYKKRKEWLRINGPKLTI